MSLIILYPNSNSNNSDRHAVVDYKAWLRHANGDTPELEVRTYCDSYAEAAAYVDENQEPEGARA